MQEKMSVVISSKSMREDLDHLNEHRQGANSNKKAERSSAEPKHSRCGGTKPDQRYVSDPELSKWMRNMQENMSINSNVELTRQ